MAVIDAIKSAVLMTTGARITEAYSGDDQIALEMADLANEAAADIAASHQWQALQKIGSLVGNGVLTAFDRPADYDRMLILSGMQGQESPFWDYEHVGSIDDWIMRLNGGFTTGRHAWIMFGDQFQFNPAPNGTALYPYISSYWAKTAAGAPKAAFDRDDDLFALPERLLKLALIWRWREMKGLEYAEDMTNYETALSQAQTRDAGPSHIIRRSMIGRELNASRSWPWELGGA